MPGLVVDVLEQGHQLVTEDFIVVGAAEPPRVAELEERDLADGADLLVGGGGLAGDPGPADDQLLRQVAHRRRLLGLLGGGQGLPGVLVAEVVFTRLAPLDVGDVEGGGLGTLLAFHDASPPGPGRIRNRNSRLPIRTTRPSAIDGGTDTATTKPRRRLPARFPSSVNSL